ncbi:signal transduction histidine kinase [Herbihabitans rhizosphaerae]|uniref:histidine kinase n=1 Tax=Herbihabitans rhizosphaerae TaxID=1872711 RepID=A0A4Q7KQL9_9PSEU|nr:HAMP domain-containing sensor histidine kinase [Herbihabitans rhizosphaerae]RZS39119.1 signal transduction histidine kinase [Herbihabitans rhizosphaerae]
MRRRLLLVLLAASIAAVAGFAFPLLTSTAAQRTQQFVIARTADVDRFAVLATGDVELLTDEVRAHTGLYGDAVVVVDARRRPVVEAGMRASDPEVAAAVDGALRNQPAAALSDLRPWSSGDASFTRPVGTGTRVSGAVVLRSSVRPAAEDVTTRWSVIIVGALAAAAICVVLARWMARWVLRPVAELDRGVREVGAGRAGAHVDLNAGPPELRGLAGSFNRMSDAVAESAEQQRRLVADTSHQLRNPMAALRLRIDALAAQVEQGGRGTYDSVVTELERLEHLLDGLLALASAESTATELAAGAGEALSCDALVVLNERADAWLAAARRTGTRLSIVDSTTAIPVSCGDSELAQVIDVLLDNAIKYAAGGTVTASVRLDGNHGVIEIVDDGPGVDAADLPRITQRFWRSPSQRTKPGSGLGLAIADSLVTTRGGTLSIRRRTSGGLAVRVELPRSMAKT